MQPQPSAAKKPQSSKTLWFNLAVVLLSAVVTALSDQEPALRNLLSPDMYLAVTTLIAAINAWLRFKTSQPLTLK